ncbi:hypothetical protein ACIRPH_31690 [Nocardiopsis sp. NPDC101807]|uniref:hypothetical protein n=1 Tax=Nocardiopsis sp. NPDC101807 TaxID=3364339 RepID=UPI0037FB0782
MHDDETTYRDPLDDLEDLLAIRAHSPRFWDPDAAEQVAVDPWEHPSWDVAADLADGWDDPDEAALLLDAVLVDDTQLDPPAPAAPLLALVPVEVDGYWPAADDHGIRGIAA